MQERNVDGLPLVCTPTRDQTHNPGMYPDRELNQGPYTLWDDSQPAEPYQSELNDVSFKDQCMT